MFLENTTTTIGHECFCTADNQCDENEGNCENDNECKNDLVNRLDCGTKNCPNSPEFDPDDNCCTKGNGHDSFCTANNLCDDNEGDCDNDNECKDGLVCGENNCPISPEFQPGDDCCFTSGVCYGESSWIGDSYCDDENNNEGCNWDGGDCCGDSVNTMYCSVCACLES